MHVISCQNCGTSQKAQINFCDRCNTLLDLSDASINAYDLLGLSPKLCFSRQELDPHYFRLSLRLHPDRFVKAAPSTRKIAEDWSLRINEAYHLLQDPISSAAYFLRFRGVLPEKDSEKGSKKGQSPQKSPIPLDLAEEYFEVMDLCTELRGDELKKNPAVCKLLAAIHRKKNETLNSWKSSSAEKKMHPQQLQELVNEYQELKYLISIEANLEKLWQNNGKSNWN